MNIVKSSTNFIKKHGADILSIISVAGLISTSILSANAAKKACLNKKEDDEPEKPINKIKPYVSTILVGCSTAICILGSNMLNKNRQACLVGLYCTLNESFAKYRNKTKELYGDEADKKILESVYEDNNIIYYEPRKILKSKNLYNESIESLFNEEKSLFFDSISNRYFESTPLIVYSAEYNLCKMFSLFGYVDVNTFYSYLGIPETKQGSEVGWSMEDNNLFWIPFSHVRTTMDDGLTCVIITPDISPYPEYDSRLNVKI